MTLSRRLAAEALGTGLLVATVVGSGIMAEQLAGGNQAIALLCNTIPTGAILVVLILAFGGLSGAHFNPVVSAAEALARRLTAAEAVSYSTVQIAGGCAGTVLANLMFAKPAVYLSTKIRSGAPLVLSEAVAAFGLLLTIRAAGRHEPKAVPYAVGLYITAAYWFTASTSFANPAVTIARTLSDSFAGIRPADAPLFIAAQCAGAFLAVVTAGWLLSGSENGGRRA